jgi:hypothetical protein
MKFASLKKAFITASILIAAGHMDTALAHDYLAIPIGAGTVDSGASDLAVVICEPGTDYFEAQVRDKSDPVPGLMVNLHIVKGAQMKTIADTVSGDTGEGSYTPFIKIDGGPGAYYMAVTTTTAGIRVFDLNYHCKANDGSHAETGDPQILQVN